MLQPKKQKYRRHFKLRKDKKVAYKGSDLTYGDYGLRVEEPARISSRQIEAGRRAITRSIKRGGKVWIRIFPDLPTTKKPPEVRMGGGKGDIDEYVAPIGAGRIVYELSGIPESVAREALRLAGHKMPVKCSVITKEEGL